jgi:NAD(P)-dependent dehydrogenase (short-subunit alcohol dehydrogenase family)
MSSYDLTDRVIAITGSTGGLGSAIATALRARGARLALLDLDADAVASQAASLGSADVARGWSINVRSMENVQEAFDAVAAHFGGIDVVIANAGIEAVTPMAHMDPAKFDAIIDVNLNGVWRTFKAALPHVQASRGYLLATSSMAAFVHSPLHAAYTASKAGVWAMTDSLRLELRRDGVDVGVVYPSFFKTPMTDHAQANPAARTIWPTEEGGLWTTMPLEQVVDATVEAIEERSDLVVVPRENTPMALAPSLFREFIDRFAFTDETIAEAIELSGAARS